MTPVLSQVVNILSVNVQCDLCSHFKTVAVAIFEIQNILEVSTVHPSFSNFWGICKVGRGQPGYLRFSGGPPKVTAFEQ